MNRDDIVRNAWQNSAEKYDVRFQREGGKITDRIQKQVLLKIIEDLNLLPKDSAILEVGCGTGRFLTFLRNLGFHNCYGLDQSSNMLKIALHEKRNKNLVRADGYSLPFKDNSFRLVFSVHVLMHVGNPRKFLRELMRVSSRYLIIDFNNLWSVRLLGLIFEKLSFRKMSPHRHTYKEIKQMVHDAGRHWEVVKRCPTFLLSNFLSFFLSFSFYGFSFPSYVRKFYVENFERFHSFFKTFRNKMASQYFVLVKK